MSQSPDEHGISPPLPHDVEEGTKVRLGRRATAGLGGPPGTGCLAPAYQLFLNPQGDVSPCCRRSMPLGNVREQSLMEVWRGSHRHTLTEALGRQDYSFGCEGCGSEVGQEGWEGSYPAEFTNRWPVAGGSHTTGWPAHIDFNLSNICNLQCLQCSGELSSAIRSQREKRPPLENPYDDRFYLELAEFIPHLESAHFAGGEPFLAGANFRVWDLVRRLNPQLPISITTNGTIWSTRARRAIEHLRVSLVVSIDAIDANTYEAIRVGANLPSVLRNVEQMTDYVQRQGTKLSINHCLMVQNFHGFGDLLLWAEQRGVVVNVSVVRAPTAFSLAHLTADRLREVYNDLLQQSSTIRPRLALNLTTWDHELARIGAWAGAAAASPSRHVTSETRVLMFRSVGDGPVDDRAARAELARFSPRGQVEVLRVGADGIIASCKSDAASPLAALSKALVGHHFDAVSTQATQFLGELSSYDVLAEGPDRLDAVARYGTTRLRIAMLPMRDQTGTAFEGRILVAACTHATADPTLI